MKRSNKAAENFGVPENGLQILDKMLTDEELLFISSAEPGRDHTRSEIEELFARCSQNLREGQTPEELQAVDRLYHRGVIDPGEKDGSYRLGNFWSRLDIFATEELDLYLTIPEKLRLEIEAEYLRRYEDSLWAAPAKNGLTSVFRPTEDEVLPIEDVLEFIDSKEEQAYLADCDCRSLRQACDAPRDVCITYRTGPFSFVRRGLAKPITRKQAREIVLRSEKLGLVHTINPGGVCNCCTDCCYLFRAAKDKDCLGTWPKVSYRIRLDTNACIGCGRCLERCRFGVFAMRSDHPACKKTMGRLECNERSDRPECEEHPEHREYNDKVLISDIDRCQGCGLCRSTCPTGALKLIKI